MVSRLRPIVARFASREMWIATYHLERNRGLRRLRA